MHIESWSAGTASPRACDGFAPVSLRTRTGYTQMCSTCIAQPPGHAVARGISRAPLPSAARCCVLLCPLLLALLAPGPSLMQHMARSSLVAQAPDVEHLHRHNMQERGRDAREHKPCWRNGGLALPHPLFHSLLQLSPFRLCWYV